MTADELVFAGGKYATSLSSPYAWYYTNSTGESITGTTNYWWTMAPNYWNSSESYVWRVESVNIPGSLSHDNVYSSYAVRPSLSLKSCVLAEGDGTSTSPYQISIDDACANAEN